MQIKKVNTSKILGLLLGTFFFITSQAQPKEVFVDDAGIMRWKSNKKEAEFYGVNYTLPFAHGYRAAHYLNIDIKSAIDKDVYHMARLGFNAYRIHIWDVEVSDKEGNLLKNEHLDLLDYLIAKLQERGIYTIITAQTNFGNGYPERDINTGSFSYQEEKCQLHSNEKVIEAQTKYIAQLVSHKNPYTKKAYMNDPYLVGFEINNEPCHSISTKQTRNYINTMVASIRETGCRKPLFYNASHNYDFAQAFFDADVQGNTYQWYPIGLVSGKTQNGNFLPFVDEYPMPFGQFNGYDTKAKLIYEYDPADVLSSYIHPAMVRSFRSAGFQWVTQFAYDPIDLAWANTEYQTHYLNLAYTPNKAISLMIAKEVMTQIKRNEQFPVYPEDTIFGNFMVSYRKDLSLLNDGNKFIYSNSTTIQPLNNKKLKQVAGVGNSPVVSYSGSGAYFLDQVEKGVWRLEIMPDVILTEDPFAKPSLKREIGQVYWKDNQLNITLDDLGSSFLVKGINSGNSFSSQAKNGLIKHIRPGVYMLGKKTTETSFDHIGQLKLNEFVAPQNTLREGKIYIKHNALPYALNNHDLSVSARIVSKEKIDSVFVYPDNVSFWNDENSIYRMNTTDNEHFSIKIPANDLHTRKYAYNIVVFAGKQTVSFPQQVDGTPLDWDFTSYDYYQTQLINSRQFATIYQADGSRGNFDIYSLPSWRDCKQQSVRESPSAPRLFEVQFDNESTTDTHFLRKSVRDLVSAYAQQIDSYQYIVLQLGKFPANLQFTLISTDGISYSVHLKDYQRDASGAIRIPIADFEQSPTALLPIAYPEFMKYHFSTDKRIALRNYEIDTIEFSFSGKDKLQLRTIWFE